MSAGRFINPQDLRDMLYDNDPDAFAHEDGSYQIGDDRVMPCYAAPVGRGVVGIEALKTVRQYVDESGQSAGFETAPVSAPQYSRTQRVVSEILGAVVALAAISWLSVH